MAGGKLGAFMLQLRASAAEERQEGANEKRSGKDLIKAENISLASVRLCTAFIQLYLLFDIKSI